MSMSEQRDSSQYQASQYQEEDSFVGVIVGSSVAFSSLEFHKRSWLGAGLSVEAFRGSYWLGAIDGAKLALSGKIVLGDGMICSSRYKSTSGGATTSDSMFSPEQRGSSSYQVGKTTNSSMEVVAIGANVSLQRVQFPIVQFEYVWLQSVSLWMRASGDALWRGARPRKKAASTVAEGAKRLGRNSFMMVMLDDRIP